MSEEHSEVIVKNKKRCVSSILTLCLNTYPVWQWSRVLEALKVNLNYSFAFSCNSKKVLKVRW